MAPRLTTRPHALACARRPQGRPELPLTPRRRCLAHFLGPPPGPEGNGLPPKIHTAAALSLQPCRALDIGLTTPPEITALAPTSLYGAVPCPRPRCPEPPHLFETAAAWPLPHAIRPARPPPARAPPDLAQSLLNCCKSLLFLSSKSGPRPWQPRPQPARSEADAAFGYRLGYWSVPAPYQQGDQTGTASGAPVVLYSVAQCSSAVRRGGGQSPAAAQALRSGGTSPRQGAGAAGVRGPAG
jgi:hypothetical protein